MYKKIVSVVFGITLFILTLVSCPMAQQKEVPRPLKVAYTANFKDLLNSKKMQYAKSVGIDYVKTSINGFIDRNGQFKISDAKLIAKLKKAKMITMDAGIKIWSIHMPYGKNIDLSLKEESQRRQVVALQKKVLGFVKILDPQIILFHPSYYLGLDEREIRKKQMIKSARELVNPVINIGAKMVIENMLGYHLLKDSTRERPLLRTVDETVEVMNRLPGNIYAAVDMNHIHDPERLIRALGKRVKQVHIADGHGRKERHYFPCSGKGGNDWVEILSALDEVGYSGPFVYEVRHKYYDDLKELPRCYRSLYNRYIKELY